VASRFYSHWIKGDVCPRAATEIDTAISEFSRGICFNSQRELKDVEGEQSHNIKFIQSP
jgi:tRNA U34 2-thiouridine synthase MnmA/TrmU